jgi:hypothetical protein
MRNLLTAVVMLGLCGCVQERTGLSHNEVPAPVMRTLEQKAPGKVDTIVREKLNGRATYHARVTSGEKSWDVVVDESGELVSKKEK